MPVKHFVITPAKSEISKESIVESQREQHLMFSEGDKSRFGRNKELMEEEDNLRHVPGRVIVKIDDKGKDFHTFQSGLKIRLERRFNNFNKRETHPVNAVVISGENIQAGSEILIHPNETHDSNRIFDYKENNSDIGYFSIKEEQCFAWHNGVEWQPMQGFDFAFRVYKPYTGMIAGIEPTVLKDYLWITSGKYKNNVVKTIVATDYEIVAQDKNGREVRLIRFRPMGDEKTKREEEAIAIMNDLTDKVNNGELYVGLNEATCKPLNGKAYAD